MYVAEKNEVSATSDLLTEVNYLLASFLFGGKNNPHT